MRLAIAWLAALGAAATLFAATATAADPTATVRLPACQGNGRPGSGSGMRDVPVGSRVLLGFRWIGFRGTIAQLLEASDIALRINGAEIGDADSHWGPITRFTGLGEQEPGDQPLWTSEWLYDTGITLASPGDQLVVFSRFGLVRKVRTIAPDGGGGFLGPTENVLDTDSCTVTAR